jgi:hypothetical protein
MPDDDLSHDPSRRRSSLFPPTARARAIVMGRRRVPRVSAENVVTVVLDEVAELRAVRSPHELAGTVLHQRVFGTAEQQCLNVAF